MADQRFQNVINGELVDSVSGETYDVMDSVVPGFGVRVSETRRTTFVLLTRYPGSSNPTRRALGLYGALTLEQARKKARNWLEDIRRGVDPRDTEERQRQAEQRKRANTFAHVVEDFINLAVIGPNPDKPKMRQGAKVARELRTFFVPLWGGKPISDISREQVTRAIKLIVSSGGFGMLHAHGIKATPKYDRGPSGPAPAAARNLLAFLKSFFNWAVEQGEYGLEQSPCRDIKTTSLVGTKHTRQRVLTDLELAALWRVTKRERYPFQQVHQLLILTGLRLNEVDLKDKVWTIPASRMKGTDAKAKAHLVPLTNDMIAILDTLPRFNGGDCLFSLSLGERPAKVGDNIKKPIDAKMLRSLQALARLRCEDPARVKIEDWTNHDIRRTLRTNLARLRVDSDTAEAVLAHAKGGIIGVYNTYNLLDEKREALTLWGARLREITSPPEPQPDNVVKMARA